ncbi:MAG: hypothetical protein WBD24_06520 [Candidatus Omnitrophota bacterium]
MENKELLKKLSKLGFTLFEKEEYPDVNKVLCDVVKSRETRLLEGFPIILLNAMRSWDFKYSNLIKRFTNKKDKELFLKFLELSFAMYKHDHIDFERKSEIYNALSESQKKEISAFLRFLKENKPFSIGDLRLSAERLKNIFARYYKSEETKTRETLLKQEEFSLEYAMSQVFSPKQKNLFKKKLRGEKMTKTEREYYSRTVKKKVVALSNSELHNLARKILEI